MRSAAHPAVAAYERALPSSENYGAFLAGQDCKKGDSFIRLGGSGVATSVLGGLPSSLPTGLQNVGNVDHCDILLWQTYVPTRYNKDKFTQGTDIWLRSTVTKELINTLDPNLTNNHMVPTRISSKLALFQPRAPLKGP